MRPVAFLTAECMLEDSPRARTDAWEHTREFEPMSAACADRGIDLRAVVWDEPGLDVTQFEAVVVGTTWDYPEKFELFLETLERFESQRPLFNPLSVIRWNLDKTYLNELAAKGASTVPTLWRDRADEATIRAAFDELGADDLVVKPVVGAGAWRQARVKRGEPIPHADELPPAATMIQPFLPSVVEEGEYSIVYFDRVFSHALRKRPTGGDYRVQSMFGGRESVHEPTDEDLAITDTVLRAVDGPLLYARVDLVRGFDGTLAVIELELLEPYLYPEQGPRMGESFADALERYLDAAPVT